MNCITTAIVQSTYALRVLRAHSLTSPKLREVTWATAVAKLTHTCSSWWDYADSAPEARIQAVMYKFKRIGFLLEEVSFVHICQEQDNKLFIQSLFNEHHVLHQLLPPIRNILYSFRPRAHDYELPVANTTLQKNFITRMLYKNTYVMICSISNDDFAKNRITKD